MIEIISRYFLLFIMYSFLGWCMETTLISIQNKRFINRGFLLGPYCPIYGYGSLFIVTLLGRYSYDPLVLFVMTVVVCSILEYFTSWIMEILFKARWWDYSKRKFNLNGRVCLYNAVAFGVLGLLVNYVLNPCFKGLIEKLSTSQLYWVAGILATIYIIDNIISFIVIFGFRKVTKTVNSEKKEDNTEQITSMVRQLFAEKSFLHRRFINAYPRLEAIKTKIKEIRGKIEDVTNDAKNAVNEKKEELTRQAKEKINKSKENIKSTIKEKINKEEE